MSNTIEQVLKVRKNDIATDEIISLIKKIDVIVDWEETDSNWLIEVKNDARNVHELISRETLLRAAIEITSA